MGNNSTPKSDFGSALGDMAKSEGQVVDEYTKAMAELNETDRAFVAAYVETGNKAEAARRAGSRAQYPEQVGWRIFRKPAVTRAIALHQTMKVIRAGIDKDDLIYKALAVYHKSYDENKMKDALEAVKLLGVLTGLPTDPKSVPREAQGFVEIQKELENVREADEALKHEAWDRETDQLFKNQRRRGLMDDPDVVDMQKILEEQELQSLDDYEPEDLEDVASTED